VVVELSRPRFQEEAEAADERCRILLLSVVMVVVEGEGVTGREGLAVEKETEEEAAEAEEEEEGRVLS